MILARVFDPRLVEVAFLVTACYLILARKKALAYTFVLATLPAFIYL